jgi:hypothetical protein
MSCGTIRWLKMNAAAGTTIRTLHPSRFLLRRYIFDIRCHHRLRCTKVTFPFPSSLFYWFRHPRLGIPPMCLSTTVSIDLKLGALPRFLLLFWTHTGAPSDFTKSTRLAIILHDRFPCYTLHGTCLPCYCFYYVLDIGLSMGTGALRAKLRLCGVLCFSPAMS